MDEAALLDEAMLAWFPPSGTVELSTRSTFTETDLRGISDLLYRSGKHSWSHIPRIYTTLRLIDELDVIGAFLSCGITDLSLPFNQRTLPGQFIDQSSRVRFLDVQSRVLTKALDLEKEKGKHRHFSNPDDLPFKKVAELGKGGYGFVDKVLSTVTYREYARKLIPRGRAFRQDRDLLRNFENELQVLKKLSHRHIVRLIGSYTDPHYVGLLMDPVADCNLKVLLSAHPLSSDTRSLVRTFYGCLASAVLYLHENKLRHKDIKPENVLVKSHHVYLTDFGTTLDWSDTGHDTTTGLASGLTLRYSAPEVATNQPRNASADIWSLGCVFLEIWTELCDRSTSELNSFMKDQGTKSSLYYANISAVREWCDMLSSGTDNDAHIPNSWIRSMLEINPSTRCSIQSLTEDIQISNFESGVTDSFSGLCCNGGFIAAESVVSSNYQASTITTNQYAAASATLASADTVLSTEEVLKHDVMSSRVTVEKRGQSLRSGRFDRDLRRRRSKTPFSKKRDGISGDQSHQEMTEIIHEEVETSSYKVCPPGLNDGHSRVRSRYGMRREQSIRKATSTDDIEVSSPTLGCLPDILNEKTQTSDDLHADGSAQQEYTHSSDDLSEPTYDHHTKSLATPHSRRRKYEKTHVQTGNNRHEPFILEPPLADDERTVKEVIYQWLTNFDPSTYCKVMTIDTVECPSVPMYRLGEKRYEPKLPSFTEPIDKSGVYASTRIALHRKSRKTTSFWCASSVSILGVWKDVCHVLDSLHVPYFVNEDHIVCFYPKGILPKYDRHDTGSVKGLRSFELLSMRRYETLQWWHGCLTSPQDTWTKKLRSLRLFRFEISGTDESLTFDFWELTPLSTKKGLTQIPGNKQESKMSNTYSHICSALGHSCFALFDDYPVETGSRYTYYRGIDNRSENVLRQDKT